MTDGTKWRQTEYYYEYFYAYMPQATITNDESMLIDGMSRAVGVRQVFAR